MLGPVPRKGDQDIILPELDWQVNQKNRASFTFNRMRWASPRVFRPRRPTHLAFASFRQ